MERLFAAWIISSWLLTALDAVVGPKFSNLPEPIVAPLGDEVEFECSLDVPAEQIRWKHNSKLLPKVVTKNATKSQLIFRVEKESQGEYQCVAWYGASALASTPARLTLATLGSATAPFRRKLLLTAGNNVLINCSAPLSNPPADVQYYKNDIPLNNAHVMPSGSLLLKNVSQPDSGQYSCSVTNNYVADSTQLIPSYHNLNVVTAQRDKKPPEVSFPPITNYITHIGTNVTLECVGFGEPVPRVAWRRSGGPIDPARARETLPGLHITEVRPADEGIYICDISNGVEPSLSFRISLSVLEPPVIVKGPEDREAKEGGRTSLSCTVRGKPTPSVYWLLNGNIVTNDSHVRVYGDRLELDKIEKRQAGWYQCMGQNEAGSTFATSELLVVPRQVTFNNSQDRSMEPSMKYTTPSHRKKHHKKTKEMVPPSRPNMTRLTDESVMVRWHVPFNVGLPIVFFKVQYREMRKGKGWMTNNEDIPPHVNSYEVTGLTPDSDYKFRIAAVYSNLDNMQGPTSAKFHLRSVKSPKLVPHAPRLSHLSPAGQNSIKIVWEYNATKPAIEGFYVYYRSTSSAGDYLMATVEGEAARSHIVTHLEPDTAYDFKLQSFTVSAPSDFSEILTQKTERMPTVSPPVDASTPATDAGSDDGSKGGNRLYVTLGAVIGGLLLLFALCTWVFCCNKQRQHHSTSTDDDDVDKSRHIQMETIHVNGHVGNHMSNHVTGSREGGVLVSKTTSNGCCNTSKMNITSNPLDADESKTQNLMEIAFITRNSCEDNCSSSVLTARLASAAVLPSCAMESESWRREMPRNVDNYV